jgi:uncharacterized membrane protein YccC
MDDLAALRDESGRLYRAARMYHGKGNANHRTDVCTECLLVDALANCERQLAEAQARLRDQNEIVAAGLGHALQLSAAEAKLRAVEALRDELRYRDAILCGGVWLGAVGGIFWAIWLASGAPRHPEGARYRRGACARFSAKYSAETVGLWPRCSSCGFSRNEHEGGLKLG